jgi:hypothetical protein
MSGTAGQRPALNSNIGKKILVAVGLLLLLATAVVLLVRTDASEAHVFPAGVGPNPASQALASPDTEDRWGVRTPALPDVPVPDAPASDDLSGFSSAVNACARSGELVFDPEAYAECVRSSIGALPSPTDVASWLCSEEFDYQQGGYALGTVFRLVPPGEFFQYISDVQGTCAARRESYLLLDAFKYARQIDSAWASEVVRYISAEAVFCQGCSQAPVQLLELFASEGDANARLLLEDGGRGLLGGSGEQTLRAATIATVIEASEDGRLAYLKSLLDSPYAPADEGVGCLLAHFLLQPGSWPDGDCHKALQTLEAVLDDGRFSFETAAQVSGQELGAVIPASCQDYWSYLREKAAAILADGR